MSTTRPCPVTLRSCGKSILQRAVPRCFLVRRVSSLFTLFGDVTVAKWEQTIVCENVGSRVVPTRLTAGDILASPRAAGLLCRRQSGRELRYRAHGAPIGCPRPTRHRGGVDLV